MMSGVGGGFENEIFKILRMAVQSIFWSALPPPPPANCVNRLILLAGLGPGMLILCPKSLSIYHAWLWLLMGTYILHILASLSHKSIQDFKRSSQLLEQKTTQATDLTSQQPHIFSICSSDFSDSAKSMVLCTTLEASNFDRSTLGKKV